MKIIKAEDKISSEQKKSILAAIHAAEAETTGEIRVHLSYDGKEQELLKAAEAQFQNLKMHETKDRNGILLYINPTRHQFSVFGDSGIHAKVGQEFWNSLADRIRSDIREKDIAHGIVKAVHHMGQALREHFPHQDGQKNELSDDISESE